MKLLFIFHVAICALAVDIIQVDVGNSVSYTGRLNMRKNSYVHPSNHGTDMARSLKNQLDLLNSKPVDAEQITWQPGPQFKMPLLAALHESLTRSVKVLSLSYGGIIVLEEEKAILEEFANRDVVMVAAAGNAGGGRLFYPANYKNKCILSVGTLFNGVRAPFSNDADSWLEYVRGDAVGTSASAARMAGIVLQYKRKYPKHSCDQIVKLVKQNFGGRK